MQGSRYLIFSLVICLVFLTSGAMAAKITGGAEQILAGGDTISVTVNAIKVGPNKDVTKGNIQYTREDFEGMDDLIVHAKVDDFYVNPDGEYAVAIGEAMPQYDPGGQVFELAWVVVQILEGGTGAGDQIRFRIKDEDEAKAILSAAPTTPVPASLPGEVLEGEFKLRAD